jgi:fructose-bisphosphate aldolase class I
MSAGFPVLSTFAAERQATMKLMLARGKGVLAADEAIHEGLVPRFAQFGVGEVTEEARRQYRSMMFGTEGLEQFIAGIIFHEETLQQRNDAGTNLADLTRSKGILVGLKTDRGLVPFVGGVDGELATEGLDGYYDRCLKIKSEGVRFVKWRCVYRIQNGTVSEKLIEHNAVVQARYAILSQAAGLVPIVEPEVMIDGDHSLATSADVSERVWSSVIRSLQFFGVELETIVLKPNMCVQGLRYPGPKATPAEVAEATLRALRRTIPGAVRMIAFLSGGLGDLESTQYLQAMAAIGAVDPLPWKLSCSFARAVQNPALAAWQGKAAQVEAGRCALLHRTRMNSLAMLNQYSDGSEKQ